MDLRKIKLIIWDLDNTFWDGILSENGSIIINDRNIQIVKKLAKRGIISSICSKNDFKKVDLLLKKNKINDFFVFKSINWDAKGPRIKQIINDMNLTESSVLFIDDNPSNLAEATFFSPKINVSSPEIIQVLESEIYLIGKDDVELSRLRQYKNLEKKTNDSKHFRDANSFLKQSKIIISIEDNCENEFSRIHELLLRTNQLNFTKRRLTKEELTDLLNDDNHETRYIKCSDKYGDYGVVGFYSLRKTDNCLVDFLFSCRTMGMNVESFIYNYLGCPNINIVKPVTTKLEKGKKIDYISISTSPIKTQKQGTNKFKIFLRGPCDLDALVFYLNNDGIISELAYVGEHKESLYQIGHSQVVLDSYDYVPRNTPFVEDKMYCTKLYQERFDVVVLSVLAEAEFGLYEDEAGRRIVYGECYRSAFEQLNLSNYQNGFKGLTQTDFDKFSDTYKFLGRISIKDSISNWEKIINLLPKETKICLLLGPTKPVKNEQNYSIKFLDGESYYKELNIELTKLKKKYSNLFLINPKISNYKNRFFAFDSSTHYSRKTYYHMAKQISKISNFAIKSTYKKEMLFKLKRSLFFKLLVKMKNFLKH